MLSAKRTIEALNPDVNVVPYEERLTSENVERILADGWDVIVDGADNFPTRYLVNDASVWHDIPVVHGSIYRFEGQVTVFHPHDGPCYRCLYPAPPPPELAPSCAEGGVLGVLPGHRRLAAGERGDQADHRRGRHAHRAAPPLRRAPHDLRRGHRAQGPGLPRLRRVALDHRVHRLRRVLPGTSSRMTAVRIPPTLRGEVGGERQIEADGDTVRAVLEDIVDRYPGARAADLQRRRDRHVRQRLPRRRGRAHARRPRHRRRSRPDGDPPARHGGRCDAAALAPGRRLAARPDRQHAARRAAQHLAEAGRQDLREARGPEPDRLDQGPRREVDDRRRRGLRRADAGPPSARADVRATPATRWRWSRSSRATPSPA